MLRQQTLKKLMKRRLFEFFEFFCVYFKMFSFEAAFVVALCALLALCASETLENGYSKTFELWEVRKKGANWKVRSN